MAHVFSQEHRHELWRRVELAALGAYVEEGAVSLAALQGAEQAPVPSVDVVAARERLVQHDVVSFLLEWTATMPVEASSVVHRGLTSSDIVDTSLALQLQEAATLILRRLDRLVAALRDHALAHQATVRVGRTHGQVATTEVWGHRVADFAFAADRARIRLIGATRDVAVGKLSGPTGAYLFVSPAIEARAIQSLGLNTPEVATQVIMRDGIAAWVAALAGVATVCEAVALEVRLGQHASVRELAEGFSTHQVGSSSMPHKRNPITSEQICGLARVVRSYIVPVMEGVALWHERDISHSSVERICLPDASALTEYVVAKTTSVVTNLVVDVSQMERSHRAATAALNSHTVLVALADAGMSFAEAWQLVHEASNGGDNGQDFVACLHQAADAGGIRLADSVDSFMRRGANVHLDSLWQRVAALPTPGADTR